jgi:hypothetical protein
MSLLLFRLSRFGRPVASARLVDQPLGKAETGREVGQASWAEYLDHALLVCLVDSDQFVDDEEDVFERQAVGVSFPFVELCLTRPRFHLRLAAGSAPVRGNSGEVDILHVSAAHGLARKGLRKGSGNAVAAVDGRLIFLSP